MDIESYMPHRGRMKLVEDLVHASLDSCTAEAVPNEAWPFFSEEGIDPLVSVELIAQATSAYVGWCRRDEKPMGGAGFLVGIRSAEIGCAFIPLGMKISISCRRILDMDNYGVFEGKVYSGDAVYGTATIQVYNP